MEKELNEKLDEIIDYIKNTSAYKNCLIIKKKLTSNVEITETVEKIKSLQKEYVKSNYQDKEIKEKLDKLNSKLQEFPIFITYMNNLEEVNEMLNLLKDELNTYFDNLFNTTNL